MVRSLLKNDTLKIRYPYAVRPWQHVLEPLFGYIHLAESQFKNRKTGCYNFGPYETQSEKVRTLIDEIFNYWGSKCCEEIISDKAYESSNLTLNIDKALRELNWKPIWGFSETVRNTIYWYKNFHNGKSAFNCINSDIERYIKNPRFNYFAL